MYANALDNSRNSVRLGDTAIVTVARFAVTLSAAIGLFTLVAAYAQTGAACDAWNTGEFFKAANVADVDRCLEAGADLNARTGNGSTPLHYAAANNDNPAVVAALVEVGASPNVRNEGGLTPLHSAAFNENPAIIVALVDLGADANARAGMGLTPLHVAALQNQNPRLVFDSGKSKPVVSQ